ncbi:DNA-directed RNA polymerase subunit RPC12/RpoP [Providencia alcalifaciens]|nr:DNA-directed RNA polymerase subunit RPC12/RpoP [Providencia alcalifaciens]
MTDKKYKCHDCGNETMIVPKYSELSNRHGFIITCPHCGYEAGLFSTAEDAEFIINSNLSQGCNE